MIPRSLLAFVASFLPKRLITRDDGAPYLERYYLVGGLRYFPPGQDRPKWWQRALTWLPCVYLHRFAASDSDEELHNHPWRAKSLILAGGYKEERRVTSDYEVAMDLGHLVIRRVPGYAIVEKAVRPGDVNVIDGDTFHRVTLLEDDCWSLIKIGEKVQTWGFWNPRTNEFVHWKEHLRRRQERSK